MYIFLKNHFLFLLTVGLTFVACQHPKAETQAGSWIRINQAGYLPQDVKVAVFISEKSNNSKTFQVKDAQTNRVVLKAEGITANAGR